MASLLTPDELNIQTASSRLQPDGGSSETVQGQGGELEHHQGGQGGMLTLEHHQAQHFQRIASGRGSRLEQLQIQQQPDFRSGSTSGWQFGKMHCAVISILMIVLLLTLLDVWMEWMDHSSPGSRNIEPRAKDVRNLTGGNRNLTEVT